MASSDDTRLDEAELRRAAAAARARLELPDAPSPAGDAVIDEIKAIGRRAKLDAEARFGPIADWPAHPCERCERISEQAARVALQQGRPELRIAPAEAESYLVRVDARSFVRRWRSHCRPCADLLWSAEWTERYEASRLAGDVSRLTSLEAERREWSRKGHKFTAPRRST